MTLLRIGGRYINFDLVCYVDEDDPAGVRLFFWGEPGGGQPLLFAGEEAEALRRWLRLNSAEARPQAMDWNRTRTGGVEAGG